MLEHIGKTVGEVMSKAKEAAFPQEQKVGEVALTSGGLSKLEFFSGLALAGILAANDKEFEMPESEEEIIVAKQLIKRLEREDATGV